MAETSGAKVNAAQARVGEGLAKGLATGVNVSMRLWENLQPGEPQEPTSRDYESVGYVIAGRAELTVDGQVILLEAGDSWAVPKGAVSGLRVLESFTAVEATHPPTFVAPAIGNEHLDETTEWRMPNSILRHLNRG